MGYHEDWVEREKSLIMLNIRTIEEQDNLLKILWNELENAYFFENDNGELILAHQWKIFSAGTTRDEIWHWFDERYSKGIVALLHSDPKEKLKTEIEKNISLCNECMSEHCVYNPTGICKLPLIKGRRANISDDGCEDCIPSDILHCT